jgi:hypothetical protein
MRGRGFTKEGDYHSTFILEGSLGFAEREFEFWSREGSVQYRGHRFAGGFGHGGQDIHMVSWS